jgi:hypothetical protein
MMVVWYSCKCDVIFDANRFDTLYALDIPLKKNVRDHFLVPQINPNNATLKYCKFSLWRSIYNKRGLRDETNRSTNIHNKKSFTYDESLNISNP